MSWFEKNRDILKRIETEHTFTHRGKVKTGNHSWFISSGLFDEPRRLWTGLKYPLYGGSYLVVSRAASELAILSILYKEAPELTPMFPRFYGVVTPVDKPAALVVDDYSKGGKVNIQPCHNLPRRLLEVTEYGFRFGMGNSLEQIAVIVGGRPRIMDLSPATFHEKEDEEVKQRIEAELEKYTIKVPIPPKE